MSTTSRLRGVRRASGLGLGTAAGGVLAYVFFVLVTRALGPVAAAPVSVLWVWWGFAGAALTFPLQHWITRSVTAHGGEQVLRSLFGRVAGAVVAISVGCGAISYLARDVLFHSDSAAFPALVVAVTLGSGVLGIVRGTLSSRRRFTAVGASLAAENGLRCVAAAALIAAGVDSPVAYGACLVAGYLVVAFWPSSLRFGHRGAAPPPGAPMALVGGFAVAQLLAQLALTGGPVLLAVAGGAPAEVTALFAGMALFRAPYTLSLGLVAPLTSRLTTLVVRDRSEALRRLRVAVVGGALGSAVLAGALGGWLGPPLITLVFGEGVRLDGDRAAVLAIATVLALANLVLTVVIVARGRSGGLVRGWLAAMVPGALLFALSGQSPVERTCWTFLAVEAAALVWFIGEDVAAARSSARLLRRQEDR